jgi:endonuclease I
MRKKTILFIFMLAFAFVSTWAQGPNNSKTYYQSANGKSGQALKTAMYNIITKKNVKSYSGLLDAYRQTDVRSDGYLRDWYSNTTHYVPGSSTGTYSGEGDTYNREHLVPQSWFGSTPQMKCDIVHVVPADGSLNGQRGNDILAEVGTVTGSSITGYCKWGKCKTPGYTGTVFEPNDEVKGDIARIYFYAATCYEGFISSWADNAIASYVFDGSTYPGFKNWYLTMLMRWSKEDPIDDVEIARNNAVKTVQDNRNPFVDYPGLEDYIWGNKKTEIFYYDNYNGTSDMVYSPIFSPNGGTYATPQNVTISTSTTDATIYYAFGDGDYAIYTSGTIIPITETTTIKAYAEKDGIQSSIATATYTINENLVVSGNTFAKVTSDSQITIGGEYIIVNETNEDVAGPLSNKILSVVDVNIYNNVITLEENSTALVFTLGGSSNGYSLKTGNQYLTSSGAKALSMSNNAFTIWSISEGDNGYVVSGNSSIGTIQYNYNNGNPRFLNYTSSQSPAVLYVKADIDTRNDANISYTATAYEVDEDSNFEAPTLNNPYHLTGITYTSSNSEVASVDENTGDVSIGRPGTTTITAIFFGNTDYKSASASYTITVKASSGGTPVTGIYEKITSTDDLEVGKNYLLVYEGTSVAYASIEGNKGLPGSVTIADNQINLNDASNHANVLVLELSSNGKWLIKDGENYLALPSAANSLGIQGSATGTGTEWNISFTNGNAYINNVSEAAYFLQYNPSANATCFRCYKGTQKYPALYKEKVTETPGNLPGDVNGDGLVNIADVVAIVNYILGDTPEVFYEDAADMNEDDEINITDAVKLVENILNE